LLGIKFSNLGVGIDGFFVGILLGVKVTDLEPDPDLSRIVLYNLGIFTNSLIVLSLLDKLLSRRDNLIFVYLGSQVSSI
jgi:hypothetical protein